MLSRRVFLLTGSSIVAITGAQLAGCSSFASIEAAREPWRRASEGFADPRLDALAYAILAPNPHNRQPWLIELGEDLQLTLYCDLERLLVETDPFNRQIVIGLGAFLELFRQAAAELGYAVEVLSFPEGEPAANLDGRPIAHIKMTKDDAIEVDPLFEFALYRRTVRRNFTRQPVRASDLREVGLLSKSTNFEFSLEPEKVDRLKDLCTQGWGVEVENQKAHGESVALTRIGHDAVIKNPDGISLHGPLMETYRVLGILSKKNYRTPGTLAYNGSLSFYNGLINSAAAFAWLSSDDNSRKAQLDAGAQWVRLNLAATKRGIAMHPLSQLLQEFPAMKTLYELLHQELGVAAPRRVQGLFRFGYAQYPKAAPRWPLQSRLINA